MVEAGLILRAIGGFLKNVPWQIYAAIGALAIVWFAYRSGHENGYEERTEEYEAAAARAVEQARGADNAAAGAVAGTKDEVERTNDEVRKAAAGSDDPLRDGLNRLR